MADPAALPATRRHRVLDSGGRVTERRPAALLSILDGEIEWAWSGGLSSDIFRGVAVDDDGTAYVLELSTPAVIHAIDRAGNERFAVPIDHRDRFPLDLAWHDGRLYAAGWARDSAADSPSYASCWNVGP